MYNIGMPPSETRQNSFHFFLSFILSCFSALQRAPGDALLVLPGRAAQTQVSEREKSNKWHKKLKFLKFCQIFFFNKINSNAT
jgi:hypothetical protein